ALASASPLGIGIYVGYPIFAVKLRADAALLHAAEGCDRDDALVDADDAVFEGLGDAPDAADVAAVEIGGEPELGVVGHLDRLVLVLEAVERRNGPEGLLLGNHHGGRHIGTHRPPNRTAD